MDGLFNKFLSVLREATDDNKTDETGSESDTLKETEHEINEGNVGDRVDEGDTVRETGVNKLETNNGDCLTSNGVSELEDTRLPTDHLLHNTTSPLTNVSSETESFKSESLELESTESSSTDTDLLENPGHSLEEEEEKYCIVTLDKERREQYVDVVPIEGLPLPVLGDRLVPEYTPSLQHSPSHGVLQLQRDISTSPSLFDRSIEFLKREFDSLRFSLGTRPLLTHTEWFNLFNSDGQMLDAQQFYNYLLEYDWPTELLQEGWKYLFEFYETFSNHNERVLMDKNKENELNNLFNTWSEILQLNDEDDNVDKARVQKLIYLINKDVPRTDRDHPFYISSPENSDVLRDLLVTFCFTNPDIGYVQGMNEVLSMFLVTVDDKVAAYWGFSNYVLRNKLFFNSTGLMAKLNGVAELLNIHDPELYNKLKFLDCSNMLFCQRWILLAFKRESKTFDMATKIFTTINSLKPTHYIQLQGLGKCELLSLDMFLVIAILVSSRSTLLSFTDQTDVYQWTGKLKLSDMSAICHARQMYEEWASRTW
ncbi:TBC1 domain family member 17-like [Bolinopsis microptera]|uniref:TBC1 domain family member 17-like n=1 Tax=Bolinopsis microptera TaxID=2820187 RepID=UPI003078FC46